MGSGIGVTWLVTLGVGVGAGVGAEVGVGGQNQQWVLGTLF